MTYANGGLIEAIDYNNFVANVNILWGVGGTTNGAPDGSYGYGQASTLATVANGNTVTADQWIQLINRIDTMDQHQTNTTSGITAPVANTLISYISTLQTMISTLTSNRLTTFSLGSNFQNNLSNTTTWTTTSTKELRLDWANANAMRYFFNAGGRIEFTGMNSLTSGNTKSVDYETLLNDCGVIRISADTSAKLAGAGTPSVINTNAGFYDIQTANTIILRQYSTNTLGGYNLNYATFQARLNANANTNTATSMFVSMVLTDASADTSGAADNVTGNVIMTTTVQYPSSSFLGNTWGAVTVNATATNTQA